MTKETVETVSDFIFGGFPGGSDGKVLSLDWKDPLEKGMATHSSIFAWRTPWTEELIGL